MSLERIVNIYRNCGFTISQVNGYYFLNGGWINYSFPQLFDIPIQESLINSLKWKYTLSVIRTEARIKNTYEFILETNDYSLDHFPKKRRTNIRKSLKDCVFKRPSLEDLYHFGLQMNQQTLKRQNRRDKFLSNKSYWRKYISTFYFHDSVDMLGAYIENKMIGYLIVYKMNGVYNITHVFYDEKASASNPVPGLIYTLVNQLIEKNGTVKISYGLNSFRPLPSLNKYKEDMLFQRVPATRVYIINPVIKILLKLIVFYFVRILRKKNIKNPLIRNVVSLVQGNRIIEKVNLID